MVRKGEARGGRGKGEAGAERGKRGLMQEDSMDGF